MESDKRKFTVSLDTLIINGTRYELKDGEAEFTYNTDYLRGPEGSRFPGSTHAEIDIEGEFFIPNEQDGDPYPEE